MFFRAWGVMTPVGIKTAARVGFPADHIIGDIWSGSEEDVRPAGAAANGYLAVSVFPSGTDFKVSQILKKDVLDAGKGDLKDQSKFGSVYYNAGVVTAIIYTEALRAGHKKFGNHPLTSEQGQWALEHLDITPAAHRGTRRDRSAQPAQGDARRITRAIQQPKSSSGTARTGKPRRIG